MLRILIPIIMLLQSCHYSSEASKAEKQKSKSLSEASGYNIQLGLSYLKQGDISRAKTKLLTALKQEPKSTEAHAAMAYYFEQTGQEKQAKRYYLKALSLDPNSGAQLNNYGTYLCRQGDYKKSLQYFMDAAQDESYVNTAAAYENAGICANAIPDINKSIKYYSKALELDSSRSQSFYELLRLQKKQDNTKAVLSLIKKYPEYLKQKYVLTMAYNAAKSVGDKRSELFYKNRLAKISQPKQINSNIANKINA